ncbi:amyloid beta A4 precursor protein-binding family B member 1-interacting protein-like [Panonychus citri]|uniref:amyloid beta A4 precursor protein-binding family B member 1-interacting protein-like n=1 Tax=Panonychus citri TaxID=50023 RepID=UPI002306ECB0|nr:amyloid beta A4 precursor protein-binding family B member 1-interacting protein-like [Panonychus citri]
MNDQQFKIISANLHKRIKEKEAEEKRRVKMESIGGETSGHSHQGSRDSLHSRHRKPKSDSSDRPSEIDSTKNSTLNTGDDSCTINNQCPSLLKVKPPLLETSKLEQANNQIKSPIGNQQKVSTGGNQLTSNINQIQKHLIPRPPTPSRPKCSEEMSSMGLTTIKPSSNTNCPITKPSPLRPVLIKTVPIPSSPSPLPPPPPVDEVDCCLIKPGSPSTGIEPSDELPPPPESFLQELREKRNEMSSESLLERLTSERLPYFFIQSIPSSQNNLIVYFKSNPQIQVYIKSLLNNHHYS